MKNQKKVFKSGNLMAAQAAADINYNVMGYYPISPSTEIAQTLDIMRVNGQHDIHMIPADGEHPSAGICYGASITGARVFNATSSNGLSYMLEQLPVQAATRYPMVLNLVNRTVSAPLNIHCDHSDLYQTLNIGWLILAASNPQAVYDQNIIALKVAEHADVMLPAIVSFDGYITSHQKHNVEVFADNNDVREFVGPKDKTAGKYVDLKTPITVGAHMTTDFINNRSQMTVAMENAMSVYEEVAKAYGDISGRYYTPIETQDMDQAETAVFVLNSAAEIAKSAVEKLNAEGHKIGVIKPNILRPFPSDLIAEQLKGVKRLIIAERADNPGTEGSYISGDIMAAISKHKLDIEVQTLIFGLGGNEIFVDDFEALLRESHLEGFKEQKRYYGIKNVEAKTEETIISRQLNYNSEEFKVGGFTYDFDEEKEVLSVKVPQLRALMKKPKRIAGGHSACPGCGIFPGVELFLRGIEGDVIMVNQTGCAYVVTANYPYSAHKGNYIHNLFQNGASTLSGVVDAILSMKARGEIEFDDAATFVMLSGDGGMDIGMGAAIGAALRNHKMIVLEYDNEGYMNTGAQQSYSTPIGHRTSTSNVGSKVVGKTFDHKDTVQIMAATNIPYAFTGVDAFPQDLIKKAAKAQWYANKHGLVYGKILISCPLNWKSEERHGSTILEAAVNCNFFPLYEIENGRTTITYNPEEVGANVNPGEWLKYMGKSKHLLKPENKDILDHFTKVIDRRFTKLKAKHDHPEL